VVAKAKLSTLPSLLPVIGFLKPYKLRLAGASLALLFTAAGLIGLFATLLAMRSTAYRSLSENYQEPNLMEASPA